MTPATDTATEPAPVGSQRRNIIFVAVMLGMLLAALGYVLIERLRTLALQGTALATAQVDTLRIKLLKVGAVVTRNTRRIRLYLASNWPSAQTLAHAMSQLRSP